MAWNIDVSVKLLLKLVSRAVIDVAVVIVGCCTGSWHRNIIEGTKSAKKILHKQYNATPITIARWYGNTINSGPKTSRVDPTRWVRWYMVVALVHISMALLDI